jgi:hypothetical protein
MRRVAKVAILTGIAVLVARTLVGKLKPHERMMAACERMFEQMPEDFPPKRIMRGVEEIRANTARTLELLEQREADAAASSAEASSAEEALHAT